jgi:predicted nicotinamide N-methyase
MRHRPDTGRRFQGSDLPGFTTRNLTVQIGGHAYRLRVLSDRQQFADPDGHGARLGISSAQWSLFGQLWPSERLLARAMALAEVTGKRVLELGCGIGLASLVLQRRGAEVVASDIHPLAEPFLAYNAALNALPALHYRQLRWDQPLPALGDFDMIIASDVLYERGHADLLSRVVERHARPACEVLITDPGRGQSAAFTRHLETQGFGVEEERCAMDDEDVAKRGRLLHYRRGLAA